MKMNSTQILDATQQGHLAGKALFAAEGGDIHKISGVVGFLLASLYDRFLETQGQAAADHFMVHVDQVIDVIVQDDTQLVPFYGQPLDLNFKVQGSPT